MTFAWPHLLWLLLVPAAWLVAELSRGRRREEATAHPKILVAEAGSHHLSLAVTKPVASRSRPWLCLGLAFAVVALARPQWGRVEEPVFDQAREILIAIDLSRSMLSPDVKPSRLDRAKLLTQSLLEKLTGERVGLIVFSGTAFLQSPLSSDYEILREFLPALNPGFLPEGGTNYRALIDTSIGAFASTAAADRFLIVLSDGEATDDNWRERIGELKTKGIRVIGLGVGTAAGAMIPDGSGGLVKDERGAVVLSKLESGTLRELAEKTNGAYQDASSWIDLASLINATVDAGQKGRFIEKNTIRLVERFQWPLGLALWCLLVSAYYEIPVRPKPREIKLVNPRATVPAVSRAALLIALLACLAVGGAPCGEARAAEPAASPPAAPPPALVKIVGRLSASSERTAQDWAELGRETVTWGSHLQSAQQPVPEGPVRDALAAVDLGEKKDAHATDWTQLRHELEALLEKSQQQKQQQKKNDQNQQQQQKKQDDQQKQDQPKQDQKKQDQQQQKQNASPQDQSQEDSSSSKPQEQKDGKPPPSKPSDASKEKASAFGDMKNRPQPPPPSPGDTQKVGGVAEKKEGPPPSADPALALPLQKLEQLRNDDSPAELFKLMEGDKKQPPGKKTKDW